MSIANETRKKIEKYYGKNPDKNLNEFKLHQRYIKRFMDFNKPLTTGEICKKYNIKEQVFKQKFLPRLFRIGLIFIFEKRPIAIDLLNKFGLKWGGKITRIHTNINKNKQIQHYYILIPETSNVVIKFNKLIKDISLNDRVAKLVNYNEIHSSIQEMVNNIAKYEVLSKIEKKKQFKKLKDTIVFKNKKYKEKISCPLLINIFNMFFSEVGKLISETGERLFQKISNNFCEIVYHFNREINFLKIIDINSKIKKLKSNKLFI